MKILFRIILFLVNSKLRWQESYIWSEVWEYDNRKVKGKWLICIYVYLTNTDPEKDGNIYTEQSRISVLKKSIRFFNMHI